MKKYLAVAVILLFIGLAVAPSINANVSKEALVEFTTEVCGLNGGKQTVKLTQEEAEDVEDLFDSIRTRLNETESREEAEEIFKEAVVELDNYGLLGGLSVKQAQRLVNLFCLVVGNVKNNLLEGRLSLFINKISLILIFIYKITNNENLKEAIENSLFAISGFSFFLLVIPLLIPFALGDKVYIGFEGDTMVPASGWIFTAGLTGIRRLDGEFWGNLPFRRLHLYTDIDEFIWYPGVWGFKGIRINNFETYETFFLGHALLVKLTQETPYT